MSTPGKSVNAWIFLDEDEPSGSSYQTPGSSYQNLIDYGVYDSTDMVNICFANTVPTSSTTVPPGNGSTYTIELQTKTHPDGSSNLQYMQWVIRDAHQVNPDVKVLITLGYADDEFSQIFSSDSSQWQQEATDYADNLVTHLQIYGLDGFDLDWEGGFATSIEPEQFAILFTAIRAAFNAQSQYYYLTLSPASVGTLCAQTVNDAFDFVNLQLYSGFTTAQEFIAAGVDKDKLAYGAKFEPNGGVPYQTAQQAYQGYVDGGYEVATQWRLNSNDFQYEQAQQMILYQLVYGLSGTSFDDSPIVGAAGNPLISQLVVRSGDVLDALQATNAGTFQGNPVTYELLRHGGDSGVASTVSIPSGDALVEISGYTGDWFGRVCVLQITLTTRNGQVFGPFGTMNNATSKSPFSHVAPAGQSIVAFSGSVVTVPLAGGGSTQVITSLAPTFA